MKYGFDVDGHLWGHRKPIPKGTFSSVEAWETAEIRPAFSTDESEVLARTLDKYAYLQDDPERSNHFLQFPEGRLNVLRTTATCLTPD